jgi:hypothetical protein
LLENFSEDMKLSVYIVSESSRRLLLKLLGEDCERNNLVSAVLNFEELYDVEDLDEGVMQYGTGYEQAEGE